MNKDFFTALGVVLLLISIGAMFAGLSEEGIDTILILSQLYLVTSVILGAIERKK